MTPDATEPDRPRDSENDPDGDRSGDHLAETAGSNGAGSNGAGSNGVGSHPAPAGGAGPEAAAGPHPAGPGPERTRERRPLNTSGWVALVLGGGAFGASLLVAWPGAVLLAALALALALTGVVRAYRGRATNKGAALAGLALAVATVILGFFWANQAQPCVRVSNDQEQFDACYESRTGLL